ASGNDSYGHLPLSFESNRGQAPPDVTYLSRAQGQTLLLKRDTADLILAGETLQLQFTRASRRTKVRALNPQPGLSHYYPDADSKHWLTNIPNFGSVEYSEIYRGIDLVYHGEEGQLQYDFVVAPGANPRQIVVKFDGASQMDIDANGDLLLKLPSGRIITQKKPVIFQELDDENVI